MEECLKKRSLLDKRGRRNIIDLTGLRFGRLFVLEFSEKRGANGQPKWVVQCDCGVIKTVLGFNLRSHQLKSCGCIVKEQAKEKWQQNAIKRRKGFGHANSRAIYNSKIKEARGRGIEFDIHFEDWVKLASSNCYYCDIEPMRMYKKKKQEYGKFKFNGLDRVISQKPYTIDNVVPCCWNCNKAKSALAQSEFYELIEKIYFNRIVKGKTITHE